jgi:hypothetical protein
VRNSKDNHKKTTHHLNPNICNFLDRKFPHKFIVIVCETLSKKVNRQIFEMFKVSISVHHWDSSMTVQSLQNICFVFQERTFQPQGCSRLFYCANNAIGGVRALENVALNHEETVSVMRESFIKQKKNPQTPLTRSSHPSKIRVLES